MQHLAVWLLGLPLLASHSATSSPQLDAHQTSQEEYVQTQIELKRVNDFRKLLCLSVYTKNSIADLVN